jgi:hypothetical protein
MSDRENWLGSMTEHTRSTNQRHNQNQISTLTQQGPRTRAEGAGLRSKGKMNSIAESRGTQTSSVRERSQYNTNRMPKIDFFIETIQLWRLTSSLPHLITEIKICSWHTNPNLKMQNDSRKSGKESHPSSVLFIVPSKRLKDYYAPIV